MLRDKHCRETIFVPQLSCNDPRIVGVIAKEVSKPSLVGKRHFGRHFWRQSGQGQMRVNKLLLDNGETIIKDRKETPKPKNRTNSAKHFSEQFEGYTIKQGF